MLPTSWGSTEFFPTGGSTPWPQAHSPKQFFKTILSKIALAILKTVFFHIKIYQFQILGNCTQQKEELLKLYYGGAWG